MVGSGYLDSRDDRQNAGAAAHHVPAGEPDGATPATDRLSIGPAGEPDGRWSAAVPEWPGREPDHPDADLDRNCRHTDPDADLSTHADLGHVPARTADDGLPDPPDGGH